MTKKKEKERKSKTWAWREGEGERGVTKKQGRRTNPFKAYLLQLQLHKGNITTGHALYSVSSVGGKKERECSLGSKKFKV